MRGDGRDHHPSCSRAGRFKMGSVALVTVCLMLGQRGAQEEVSYLTVWTMLVTKYITVSRLYSATPMIAMGNMCGNSISGINLIYFKILVPRCAFGGLTIYFIPTSSQSRSRLCGMFLKKKKVVTSEKEQHSDCMDVMNSALFDCFHRGAGRT